MQRLPEQNSPKGGENNLLLNLKAKSLFLIFNLKLLIFNAMNIPSKIDPCPLHEVIMEVRFETNYDEGAVFGIIFNQIKNEFEKTINLPILEIPSSMRKGDPNLRYLPYYRIISKENENIIIQIGPKVFSVIITNEYPGWDLFYEKIEYGLQKLESSGVVSKVTRLALRYVNFFEENILLKSNLSIKLNDEQLNNRNSEMKFEIPDNDYLRILSISNQAIKKDKEKVLKGSIIDIDTYIQRELPNFFADRKKILEDCHISEKKLFASLLTNEYTQTLKEIIYV